jgi:hypothetical protein
MCTTRSRLGPGQYGTEVGRVPLEVCNKRNVILKVDDKSIIMFFNKGLSDSSLIRKLAMKNPRTFEEMLAIDNKYTLAER